MASLGFVRMKGSEVKKGGEGRSERVFESRSG